MQKALMNFEHYENSHSLNKLDMDDREKYIISGSEDGKIHIWNLKKKSPITCLMSPFEEHRISPSLRPFYFSTPSHRFIGVPIETHLCLYPFY
jgi:WD40 repeat protein